MEKRRLKNSQVSKQTLPERGGGEEKRHQVQMASPSRLSSILFQTITTLPKILELQGDEM